jgi:hypothetical protein
MSLSVFKSGCGYESPGKSASGMKWLVWVCLQTRRVGLWRTRRICSCRPRTIVWSTSATKPSSSSHAPSSTLVSPTAQAGEQIMNPYLYLYPYLNGQLLYLPQSLTLTFTPTLTPYLSLTTVSVYLSLCLSSPLSPGPYPYLYPYLSLTIASVPPVPLPPVP